MPLSPIVRRAVYVESLIINWYVYGENKSTPLAEIVSVTSGVMIESSRDQPLATNILLVEAMSLTNTLQSKFVGRDAFMYLISAH